MTTKCTRSLVCTIAALALGLAPPVFADWPINNSEIPGSVLVFHKFIEGTVDFPGQERTLPRSQFEISVVCPKGADCTPDDDGDYDVYLRAHWVCPGDVGEEGDADDPVCDEYDFNIETTVNGTVYFNPEEDVFPNNVGFVNPPDCDDGRGYLIVWVINNPTEGTPIKFDGLIGDGILRGPTDDDGSDFPTYARAYDALSIQASEGLSTGDCTDRYPADGNLDFNDFEYKAVTGKIYGSVPFEHGQRETSLTLLTLDVRSGQENKVTTVGLNFYNEWEQLASGGDNPRFYCWDERRITDINPNLTTDFGEKGLVESTFATQGHYNKPVTVVGIVEVVERLTHEVFGGISDVFCSEVGPFVTPGICINPVTGEVFTKPPDCFPGELDIDPPDIPAQQVCIPGTAFGTLSTDLVRDYAYGLFNDGKTVDTTFAVVPPSQPPPD